MRIIFNLINQITADLFRVETIALKTLLIAFHQYSNMFRSGRLADQIISAINIIIV
jgi:hypothetical protein